MAADRTRAVLPVVDRLLVVCAHPDDESFGLGAIIDSFVTAGVVVDLVCLTRGEASTLGVDLAELAGFRTAELVAAAHELGIAGVRICEHTDGRLSATPAAALAASIRDSAVDTDLVLVFDVGGITGHPDHIRATEMAVHVAEELDVPVLAWTLTDTVAAALNEEFHAGFVGRPPREIDLEISVDRERQFAAMRCHGSQLADNPIPARRLELTGPTETLRWLRQRSATNHDEPSR